MGNLATAHCAPIHSRTPRFGSPDRSAQPLQKSLAATNLEPGFLVTPTVRLERRIAGGGMAEIWEGEHLTLSTKVAVKCLRPELAGSGADLRRFIREAQIAAQMNDPHSVRVLDCVVHDAPEGKSAFIVMELLEGEDLGQRLERVHALSLDEMDVIAEQIARVLDRAHDFGIVHRDVKPENIFLSAHASRPHVTLLDFGVAKDLGTARGLTMRGITLGTPRYMSPEQLQGAKDVDGRGDVWALAAVVYACLTGRPPFEGRSVDAVFEEIQAAARRPASDLVEGLPASLDAVFGRAFHPEIDSRFQRATDFADALHAARCSHLGVVPSHPVQPAMARREEVAVAQGAKP